MFYQQVIMLHAPLYESFFCGPFAALHLCVSFCFFCKDFTLERLSYRRRHIDQQRLHHCFWRLGSGVVNATAQPWRIIATNN